jgi:hypothetical protein
MAGISLAPPLFHGGNFMQALSDSMSIVYNKKCFSAVKCRKCGAKMYPKSLLRPHLNRHQRKHLWFTTELSKLQNTFARMRDIA